MPSEPDPPPELVAEAEAVAHLLRVIRHQLAAAPATQLQSGPKSGPNSGPSAQQLTSLHLTALDTLRAQPRSLKDLGNQLAVSHSSINGMVGRLVARGLVQRDTDPKDKRRKLVALTPGGQHLVNRAAPAQRLGVLLDALREASPDERERIVDALTLLQRLIEACGPGMPPRMHPTTPTVVDTSPSDTPGPPSEATDAGANVKPDEETDERADTAGDEPPEEPA